MNSLLWTQHVRELLMTFLRRIRQQIAEALVVSPMEISETKSTQNVVGRSVSQILLPINIKKKERKKSEEKNTIEIGKKIERKEKRTSSQEDKSKGKRKLQSLRDNRPQQRDSQHNISKEKLDPATERLQLNAKLFKWIPVNLNDNKPDGVVLYTHPSEVPRQTIKEYDLILLGVLGFCRRGPVLTMKHLSFQEITCRLHSLSIH